MKKTKEKPTTTNNQKRDTTAFVFKTSLDTLEEGLKKAELELIDLLEYAQPNSLQQSQIDNLIYWIAWWELNMPELKRRGMKDVLTCARENAILGLYKKEKRKTKK